jgi:hypothetical protein
MKLFKLAGVVSVVASALAVAPANAAITVESVLHWGVSFNFEVFPLGEEDPAFAWIEASQSQSVSALAASYPAELDSGAGYAPEWTVPLVAAADTSHANAIGSIEYDEAEKEILRSWAYSEPSAACPVTPDCSSNYAYANNSYLYSGQRYGSFTLSAPAAVAFSVAYSLSITGAPAVPGEGGYAYAALVSQFYPATGGSTSGGWDIRAQSFFGDLALPSPESGVLYTGVIANGPGTGYLWANTSANASSPVGVIPEPRSFLLLLAGLMLVAFLSTRRVRGVSPL